MLDQLRARSCLPVPAVLGGDDRLLFMEYVAHDGVGRGDLSAADLLADLHGVTWSAYGLERDTSIAMLALPNAPSASWVEFFRDRRLLHFARVAVEARRIPSDTMAGIERLAADLGRWLEEPERPALLHGDVWSGNVLVDGDRVAAFIDPAMYYGHPEAELAFTTLFSTFGDSFYARYRERAGIRAGFFDERCALYNLYPLLVHAILFGGGYAGSVAATVARYAG